MEKADPKLAPSQTKVLTHRIDTVAVAILDHMSAVIGDLNSCSVKVNSTYDIHSTHMGLIKHADEAKLYLHGPNQMLVNSEGDMGNRQFYYDGTKLTYYSLDNNQYSQVPISAPLINMIDSVNKVYGIVFPVADFFYPTFVDDILADTKDLRFLGITKVDGKDCFHIAGVTPDKAYQFWISNDAFYLPIKEVIVYLNKELNPQYEASFSDWQVNPNLPNAIFEFSAPFHAKEIKMKPVTVKK